VGDAPLASRNVTAVTADGTLDTFTVSSSNPAVVSAVASGNTCHADAAVGAGNASIVFIASGSDPSLSAPSPPPSARSSCSRPRPIRCRAQQPAAHAGIGQYRRLAEADLRQAADAGRSGSIRIFRKSDDALVDVIRLRRTDIGYAGQALVRKVNTTPVASSGNTVTSNRTAASWPTASNTTWRSRTACSPAPRWAAAVYRHRQAGRLVVHHARRGPAHGAASLTVGAGDDADFRTVQGALNYAMQNFAKRRR
jgi:pectate lyase